MRKTHHSNHRPAILLAALILALFASSCGFIHPFLPKDMRQTIDIRIPDDMLEDSRPTFHVHGRNFWEPLLDDVTRMELHDGFLRFVGTRASSDGSVVPGTIDLDFTSQDGRLMGRIIALDIPGYSVEDPIVLGINQEMSVVFRGLLHTYGSDILFKEITVTEDALLIKVEVSVNL